MLVISPSLNHQLILNQKEIMAASFAWKWVLIVVCGSGKKSLNEPVARCKYYCAWKMSEAACILTGLGYNCISENGNSWNRLENVNILNVESSKSPKDLIANWNKNTAIWLKRDIYIRLLECGVSTDKATLLTACVSAFWHGTIQFITGLYPGYYITFVSLALLTTVERLVRAYIRPLFLPHWKRVYDIFGLIVTQLSINYIVCGFMVHSGQDSHAIYKSVYYSGHLLLIAVFLLLNLDCVTQALRKISIMEHDSVNCTKEKICISNAVMPSEK